MVVAADHVNPQTPGARGGHYNGHVAEDLREDRAVRDGPYDQHRLYPQMFERPNRPTVDPRTGGRPRAHAPRDLWVGSRYADVKTPALVCYAGVSFPGTRTSTDPSM